MRIDRAEISFLEIPFRMSVTHGARADRTYSDSLVVRIAADGAVGYGEAVVRDYVSGPLAHGDDLRSWAVRAGRRILSSLPGGDAPCRAGLAALASLPCSASELPILCAVETAVLDLACRLEGADLYGVIGMEPLRRTVAYGGVMPILPLEQATDLIAAFKGFDFPDFKVKVNSDPAYNAAVLGLCRKALGREADIRVDANGTWDVAAVAAQLDVCARFGVHVVEQPFCVGAEGTGKAAERASGRGFTFMADEGVLTLADVDEIAAQRTYHALNLRLSKNGGLSRVLAMARRAEEKGLACQLGCMVGETGILSALGRAAASLLPSPMYIEGSYDRVLLTANITTEDFGFGRGGKAQVVRGRGIGFDVDEKKLQALSIWQASCL